MPADSTKYFILGILFCLLMPFSGLSQIVAGEDQQICFGGQATMNAVVELPSNYQNVYFSSEDTVHYNVFDIGFPFKFFETVYTEFVIAPNGWISFDTALAGTYDDWHISPIPSTESYVPKKAIMGPWQDWDPVINDSSFVGYSLLGEGNLRRLVISWFNVPLTPYQYTKGTFQLILFESSNIIQSHITAKPYSFWQDNKATLGLHDSLGVRGETPPGRNGVSWTVEKESWEFRRSGNPNNPYNIVSIDYNPEIIGVLGEIEWFEETCDPGNLVGTGNTLTVTPSQTTRYVARVILNEALPFTDTVTVFVMPNPIANAGNDTSIIQGTTAFLHGAATSGTGAYSWNWEPAAMVVNPDQRTTETVSLLFPQVFEVKVSDEEGCESEIDEMVVAIIFGPLFASLTVDNDVVCAGNIVRMEVNAYGGEISQPYSYDWWSDPTGFIITDGDPVQFAQPTETTKYYVRVTDFNDSTFVDSILVSVPEVHPAITGDPTACEMDLGAVYSTPPTGNFFDWSVIGLFPENVTASGNTITIDWGETTGLGYLKVVETTSDIYHCSDSTMIPVTVFPKPRPYIITDADTICQGELGAIYSTSEDLSHTYRWTLTTGYGSFVDSTDAEVIIDWINPGQAGLFVEETSSEGCSSSDLFFITINPLPAPVISGSASICELDTVTYNTPFYPGNQYEWEFSPHYSGEIINSADPGQLTIFWKEPGDAHISVRETVANSSCTALSDTFHVTVHPKPVLSATPASVSVCDGYSDTLSLSGADSYIWSPIDGLIWLEGSTWILKPTASMSYHITGIDALTGCQDTVSYHVTFKPNPVIDLGKDQYIQPGQTIYLSPGEGYDEYYWSTGDLGSELAVNAAGRYEVTVVQEGCIGTDSIWIRMQASFIPIPNAFTPNGDGTNDEFKLVGSMEEIDFFKMQIFNRWGNMLFETSNPLEGWDGTYQGKTCEPGSYLWYIAYQEHSDGIVNPVSKQGYVNLLK
jgi:gliding motility-associated-like protein